MSTFLSNSPDATKQEQDLTQSSTAADENWNGSDAVPFDAGLGPVIIPSAFENPALANDTSESSHHSHPLIPVDDPTGDGEQNGSGKPAFPPGTGHGPAVVTPRQPTNDDGPGSEPAFPPGTGHGPAEVTPREPSGKPAFPPGTGHGPAEVTPREPDGDVDGHHKPAFPPHTGHGPAKVHPRPVETGTNGDY